VVIEKVVNLDKNMVRSISVIFGIGAVHFVVAKIIVAMTMHMGMFAAGGSQATGWIGHLLVWFTRVLYFPIISLSLYSRQWFPGNWILIPMITNSLLWGIALYGIYRLLTRHR
jgi:hypothetical protein